MPKIVKPLTDKQLKALGPGRHAVGGAAGLLLQVSDTGRKSWILRFVSPVTGRRREMGLGGYPTLSLEEARGRALAHQRVIGDGLDPLAESEAIEIATTAVNARATTFAQAAASFLKQHRDGWKNPKHQQQ